MNLSKVLKLAILAVPLCFGSCGTKKTVTQAPVAIPAEKQDLLHKVADNAQLTKFITSKVKFEVKLGDQELALTGNLRMKRDDVIQMQLMAFGFVEAARLEFTQEYVLVMDRINKQYLKVPYNQVDFMRNSGLNFHSLQALFWNELFQPGRTTLTDENLAAFETEQDGDNAIITFAKDKLSYKWLAAQNTGLISIVNVLYKDKFHGNTQLNWDYKDFKALGTKQFPTNNSITFTTPDKELKLNIVLNYLKNDTNWETRTKVSDKYREVTVDDILRRFMAL